jgi:transposase
VQTRRPGISVSQVARRYDVNANLVFNWLRDPRFAPDDAAENEARFLPVEIVGKTGVERSAAPCAENRIEIELAGGYSLRISGAYDLDALARLIRGLSA